MTFDAKIIAALIGLAGILLTTLFAAAGYFYKTRGDAKKSAKITLYLLLELRHALGMSLFDASKAIDKYIQHCIKNMNANGMTATKEDFDVPLVALMTRYFARISKAAKTDIQNRLLPPLEEALSSLSATSPVLAYKLRGKEKIEALAKQANDFLSEYQLNVEAKLEPKQAVQLNSFLSQCQKSAMEKLLSNLDNDILMLSKNCGFFEYRQCKELISRKVGEVDDSVYKELFIRLAEFVESVSKANDTPNGAALANQ